MQHQPHEADKLKAMLKEQGFEVEDTRFPALEAARESLRHLVFGCKKVSYWVYDPGSHRAVYRGMICSTCSREYPG
jgi:hypothetical protein